MKKLIVIVNAPSNALNQREEFIRHFKNIYDLSIACPNATSLEGKELFNNVKLIDLSFSRSGTSLLSELKLLLQIYKLFKKQPKGTLVHNFTIKPILYSNLLYKLFFNTHLKCFSTFTGLGYLFSDENKKKLLQKIVSRLLRFCLFTNSKSVIFQNHCDQKNFVEKKIVDTTSNVILGSGVDTDYFYMSAKYPKKPMQYLFIGRLLKDKGVYELIEAFSRFILAKPGSANLKIAGDFDPHNPQAITPTNFEPLLIQGIEYKGYQQDLRPLIKQSDVVVLPSYREGLPLALIQACSMGKIILTTSAPGCSEMVFEGKNGIKVPPKSSIDLEKALVRLDQLDSEFLFQMAKESRYLAENHFSSKIVNHKIELLYS